MFWRIAKLFQSGCTILHCTVNVWGFWLLHTLASTCHCLLFFGYSHPSRHRVVSHGGFDAHFPNDSNSQGWLVSYWDHTNIKPRVIFVYLLLPLLACIKAYWVLEKSRPQAALCGCMACAACTRLLQAAGCPGNTDKGRFGAGVGLLSLLCSSKIYWSLINTSTGH